MGNVTGAVAIAIGTALLAAPVAVPAVVGLLGFQGTGIAAGSWAASFMASYGGTVAAGSACAILQSIGATGVIAGAGLTAASGVAITASGALLAAADSALVEVAGAAVDHAMSGLQFAGEPVGSVTLPALKSLPDAIGSAGAIGGQVISQAQSEIEKIVGSAGAMGGQVISEASVEICKIVDASVGAVCGAIHSMFGWSTCLTFLDHQSSHALIF